jgi:hypothetical protein
MNLLIADEHATIRRKNINSIVRKAILKEGTNRARILYAGPHPFMTNNMVVYKIIELIRGMYFLEETRFNSKTKSVQSTLTSINKEKFHMIEDAKDKMFDLEYHPDPGISAGTSYTRALDEKKGKVFHNSIITNYSDASFICKWYINWRIRNYLNKKC